MNKMKQYLFLLLLMTGWCSSCYEDKGNYAYTPINEITVAGIEDTYEIMRWDTLKIPVTLKQTQQQDSKILYSWFLNGKKIADTKDLKYVVSEKAKSYLARFQAIDPVNDSVKFFRDFKVTIHTAYSKGLMLLSDCGGVPEMAFMSTLNNPEHKIIRNIYQLENGRPLVGKALCIEQPEPWYYMGEVFVHTSASSHMLDPVLLKELAIFDEKSYTVPDPVYDMVFCRYSDQTPEYGVGIGSNGKIYPKLGRQNRYSSPSLNPISVAGKPGVMTDYQLAPFCLCMKGTVLAYDNKSGKFMYFQCSWDIPSFDEDQFDIVRISATHIGLPFLAMAGNSTENKFTSLFYDAVTQDAKIAQEHSSNGRLRGRDSLVVLADHHLTSTSKMVINKASDKLYYSDGGHKIYLLNLSDRNYDSQEFECNLPADAKITLLKIASDNLSIYVGAERTRAGKYTGDLFKIDVKTCKILEHYPEFGGTPVDLLEKVPIDYNDEL
ncbi:MAG: PKD-like family lipoprotein [Odoribacter sp.]